MKNIHVLPTDKPSRLYYNKNGRITFSLCETEKENTPLKPCYNIYITSNEEIKEGDKDFYIIANDRDKTWINRLEKVVECKIVPNHGKVLILSSGFLFVDEGKKIILTTDQDLIKDGVQKIDDEFLEWFVKNPSCEEVEVKKFFKNGYGNWYKNDSHFIASEIKYKIIIPKEVSKYPIGGYAPGYYGCTCVTCKTEFIGDKRAVQCEPCAIEMTKEEPKQETLEEAALKYAKTISKFPKWNEHDASIFIEGAKWQIGKQDNFIIGFLEFIEGTYSYSNIFDYWYLHADTSKTYTKKELLKKYIDTLNGN